MIGNQEKSRDLYLHVLQRLGADFTQKMQPYLIALVICKLEATKDWSSSKHPWRLVGGVNGGAHAHILCFK